ncbi:MAG TPA: hypothetical protein VIV40_12245 [Kofleriaceae bacterium]
MHASAIWGIAGVVALLGNAIYRLTPYSLELCELSLDAVELVSLVVWVAFNAYSEGYRAFHRMFSPRVVARARTLAGARPLFIVLAPLYCMGLFHATKKRLIMSWSITVGVVMLVVIVRSIDQPWRGIIDAGVVIGLGFGVASILYYTARALAGHAMPVPPDLPVESAP